MIIPSDYKTFKLVAMDPGLHNIGLAVFTLTLVDDKVKIKSISASTISSNKVKQIDNIDTDIHDELFSIRRNMTSAVIREVLEIEPSFFVTESAFFNPTRPNSFAQLHAIITAVLDGILLADGNIATGRLPPKSVKKTFGIAKEIGKDPVKDAVSKKTEIMSALVQDIDELTEHAIDAIAVGYAYLHDFLDYDFLIDNV